MHLTPLMLERCYDYLLSTPPFNKWRLPSADDVEFHIKDFGDRYADHTALKRRHRIRICARLCRKNGDLVASMAHEMVHIHQRRLDRKRGRWSAGHGPVFKRLAKAVCRQHGWDVATF